MFNESQLIPTQRFTEIASARRYEQTINQDFRRRVMIKWQDRQPKEKDFKDIYPMRLIEKAVDSIMIKSRDFTPREKELGILGENICLQGFYDEEWLPAVADVIKTSEYDDLFRGTDMVFRFQSEEVTPLYLAVDVKTYKNSSGVARTIENLKTAIKKGYQTNLRYFYDEDLGIKGQQSMPNIVLILDPRYALSIQNIMVIPPVKRTLEQKQEIDFLKNLMNAEIMAQLMELDLFIDTLDNKTEEQQQIQNHYQAIIASINKHGNFAAVEKYLVNLITLAKRRLQEFPDLHQQYVRYTQIFANYKEQKEIK